MNERQAIEILDTFYEMDEVYKATQIAIEALKKQIPKKPIKDRKQEIRYTSSYSCPSCGGGFTGTGIADYCYHCGQRMDWSVDE